MHFEGKVTKMLISKTTQTVIPASGARRESFRKKDSGQAGMTEQKQGCHHTHELVSMRYGLRIKSYKNICTSKGLILLLLVLAFYFLLFTVHCNSEIFDRVVAFVDDEAITLSEFQQQYKNTLKLSPEIGEVDVLNTMINRKLLLKEAKKYRIEASSEDEVMREYIDLKVRAFIKVGETEIEDFYKQNIRQFSGRDYEDARDDIEKYLSEKELNERLKEVLAELRGNAYIKIQLKSG